MNAVETRFRVKFESDVGADFADAGQFVVYNATLLSHASQPGIEVEQGKTSVGIYGLGNIRRLRDLCDTFLQSNQGDNQL